LGSEFVEILEGEKEIPYLKLWKDVKTKVEKCITTEVIKKPLKGDLCHFHIRSHVSTGLPTNLSSKSPGWFRYFKAEKPEKASRVVKSILASQKNG
jgi:hypothetical protein